jgi:hypothetical protein
MMRKITMISAFALFVSFTFSNMVNAANAPYLPPIADQTAMIGELWNYDVDALYADPAASYQLLASRPGMTNNAATGLISWTPATQNDGGVVTVRAFNTAGESVRSFLVYLSDAIVCDPDIISYWKMDETSGTTYEDYQGGYDAISLTQLNDTAGKVNRAAVFEPLGTTDQFIYVDDQQQYDFSRADGFSVSMWINYQGQHTESTVNQVLMARGNPSMTNPHLFYMLMVDAQGYNPPRITYQIRPNSTEEIKSVTNSTSILPNQWYHIVAVYEGVSGTNPCWQRLYVNSGTPSQASTSWSAIASFDGGLGKDLEIGYWSTYPTNRYPFNGMMDEVVIFRKALSASEVSELYSDGLNGKPTCKPGNYFPLITSTPVTAAYQDVPYSYIFAASDYEGGLISLSAEIIPDWLTFNPVTGALTGTPDNLDVGDHAVKLKATDGVTDIFQEFTITVNNENDPPEITSTPTGTIIDQGDPFTYTLVATDQDPGDVVTLSAPTLPGWLTFNPTTGVLSGTPNNNAVGFSPDSVHTVVLRATDLASEFDEQQFTITVNNVNDPPVIISQNPLVIDRDQSAEITKAHLNVNDPDNHYPGEHTLTVVAGSGYTFLGNVVTPSNHFYGDLNVNIELSDGIDMVEDEFVITVNYINIPPLFTSTPVTTAKEGMAYTYVAIATDPDVTDPVNPQTLTYAADILPSWVTFDPVTKVLVGIPSRSNVGDNPVKLTVSDGLSQDVQEFVIHVTSSNNLPVITSVPPSTIDNYSEYLYKITAFDADVTDVLTFGVEKIPSWMTFNSETQILSGIPEKVDVGDHEVILTVYDGYDVVKQEFTITVRNVNTPPQINSVPNDTARALSLYTYLMDVVDHEGDAMTFTPTLIPAWLSFDVGSRVLSGTPAISDKGPHTVIITVSDGVFTINHSFTIQVISPVGIYDEAALASRVYPNPVDKYVIFDLRETVSKIEITDLSGKVVGLEQVQKGDHIVQIDVSHLSTGIYMYRIFGGNQVQTGKLVKQ